MFVLPFFLKIQPQKEGPTTFEASPQVINVT